MNVDEENVESMFHKNTNMNYYKNIISYNFIYLIFICKCVILYCVMSY